MTTTAASEPTTYRWSSTDEADRFTVEDPATGEVISIVQGGDAAQVEAAVKAAHHAFETDWRWRTPAERAALLLEGANVLEAHADELALLESLENGKPLQDGRLNDINFLIGVFRFSSAASSTSCRPSSTTRVRSTRRPTSSPSGWSARSFRSTGRRSTPAARSRLPSPPATPSS